MYQYLDGKLYSVPFYIDSMGVVFNEDLFAKAKLPTPKELQAQGKWDWPTFSETALALEQWRRTGRIHGFAARNDGQGGYFNFIFPNDGELWNHGRDQNGDGSPPAMEAIQFMADMILKDMSSPGSAGAAIAGSPDALLQPAVGDAYRPARSTSSTCARTPRLQMGRRAVPERQATGRLHCRAGARHLPKSPNADAAWELVKYMTLPEQIRHVGHPGRGRAGPEVGVGRVRRAAAGQYQGVRRRHRGCESQPTECRDRETGVPLGVRDPVVVARSRREIGEVFAGRRSPSRDAMKALAAEMNKALEETNHKRLCGGPLTGVPLRGPIAATPPATLAGARPVEH